MPSSLQSLVTAPRSGRSRPLLVEHDAYGGAVVRQGGAIPWTDLAALSGYVGQVQSLLDPDAVWLDVEALYAAHLAAEPGLLGELGARSRPGYALRTLLGDPSAADRVATTVRTLADLTRRPVLLDVPSPARWLGRVHAAAGTPVDAVDADRADTASMYLAQWLGKLGGLPVALVLLDARAAAGDLAVVTAETLPDYSSIANVVGHFEWGLALRGAGGVEVPAGQATVTEIPGTFWAGTDLNDNGDVEAADPTAGVLLTTIPAEAPPERVLERLARLS